jgi:transcriptional regulator with XRE-family HTH domain
VLDFKSRRRWVTKATLGDRIRELRTQRKLTQEELADLAHVDHTYLSKIENDRLEHSPSIKALRGLASALRVDELELMHLAGKVPAVLAPFARDKEAIRFFRRAAETMKDPEDWQELLAYLERRQQRAR